MKSNANVTSLKLRSKKHFKSGSVVVVDTLAPKA